MRQFSPVVVVILGALSAGWSPSLLAQDRDAGPPLLDVEGLAGYREFLQAGRHRAFAIAPGGSWAWVSGMPDSEVAESESIRACARDTDQRCTVFAIDDQVVLDQEAWAASWGPYLDAAEGAVRPVGTTRGMRFPDLALADPHGRPATLSGFRGKVVFVHFWGSWCPPCQTEFPELQQLYDALKDDANIAFVFVQAREDIARSRSWVGRRGLSLPLFDSGTRGPADHAFRKADGGLIEDGILAPRFPASYVLDANGVILFSHTGPLSHWPEYAPFLRHASRHGSDQDHRRLAPAREDDDS